MSFIIYSLQFNHENSYVVFYFNCANAQYIYDVINFYSDFK